MSGNVLQHASAVLPGMRVYAVGDIHGRLDLLNVMLRMIERDNSVSAPARVQVVFLGDYIDRGPDSKGVIDRLIEGLPDDMEPVFLRGNHEECMLHVAVNGLQEPDMFLMWTSYGGLAALASYGVEDELLYGPLGDGMEGRDRPRVVKRFREVFPPRHLQFLSELKTSHTVGDFFFVHGGVRPGVPLDQQTAQDCLWIRAEFLLHTGDFGKVVVHGHTPRAEPDIRPNRIGIDTEACRTGRLTVLRLEGRSRRFLVT